MRNAECGMRNAECGMRNAKCGMRNAECEMRNAECEMRNAECGMRNAECGIRIKVKVYKPSPLGKVLNEVKRMRLRCAYFYYLSCDTVIPSHDANFWRLSHSADRQTILYLAQNGAAEAANAEFGI